MRRAAEQGSASTPHQLLQLATTGERLMSPPQVTCRPCFNEMASSTTSACSKTRTLECIFSETKVVVLFHLRYPRSSLARARIQFSTLGQG